MSEEIYFYEPRGYSPGYAYRDFDDALAHLLKDSRVKTLEELGEELTEWDVWHEFDVENHSISIDDGGNITPLELR